ncbi:dihydrolipoyl dehydrogenase [Caldisalinibacter kiritimatiensis]|uniref:Dihydrolipoyl dehydrogenase n=1 Tax=Caldisalinibacter kiritimatiensis TaxID=1304284 RepID=R1AT44_9FIRM|nr:dihydrolipoyl dehydrogenase [Caldisalinibacter kiritimatiensis]EOD00308.1 Dihydrolipoamide dehydrogenase [Caldisalinibacter kiritimatiensis]
MEIDIKLENLSGHAKSGKIGKVYIKVGDEVKSGDKLFEVESNKGNVTVTSEVEGKVKSIEVEVGQEVKLNDLLVKIEGEKKQEESNEGSFNYFGGLMKPQKKEINADIVVIGGGPGGYVAAIQGAKLGAKVVLVEKENLGGTCLNWGCIPTKALVRSAQVYKDCKEAESYGVNVDDVKVDMQKVIARKDNVVKQLVGGIEYLMEKNGVQVIKGAGKLVDNETVFVKENRSETTIKAKNIIIATGSETSMIPIPGVELENVITSKEALSLTNLPDKIVIVGGGVIGMEFAFIYANLGVDVTVIEYLDKVLAALDDDVSEEITKIAGERGIKLYTDSKVESIMEGEDGECIIAFSKGEQIKYVTADKVLMAVGRKPYLEGLGVEELNIEMNENNIGIKVNEKMQTNVSNVYAIGDVTNKVQLAHVASHQGIVAVKNIMGEEKEMDYTVIPSAIFTDPEIAMVGICEDAAREANIDVEVGKFPFSANGKALTLGESRGFVKIVKDKATGKIIGGTIIGPHATDLIAEVALAIQNGLTAEDIIETIHAHPTTAESIHEGALSVEGGALHFAE